MISDETRQNSQRLPLKKIARFFFFVWPGQHIFVFPRSQLCLKFRQYAYRECRFAKTSTEARHPNSAGLAFALPFGQKGVVFAVMRQLTGWRYLMYMAGDRTLNADASPNRKVTGYEKN